MFLPRESVREFSRVLNTRESARVFYETPIFLRPLRVVFWIKQQTQKIGRWNRYLYRTDVFWTKSITYSTLLSRAGYSCVTDKEKVCRMAQSDYFLQRNGRLLNSHDKDHPKTAIQQVEHLIPLAWLWPYLHDGVYVMLNLGFFSMLNVEFFSSFIQVFAQEQEIISSINRLIHRNEKKLYLVMESLN